MKLEVSQSFKLAGELVERCEKAGVKFDLRTFLGMPTQDDALTVYCEAQKMFEELIAPSKPASRGDWMTKEESLRARILGIIHSTIDVHPDTSDPRQHNAWLVNAMQEIEKVLAESPGGGS